MVDGEWWMVLLPKSEWSEPWQSAIGREVIKYSRGEAGGRQETTKWEMNVMTGQFTALSPLLPSQPFIRFLQNCDCLLIKFMVSCSHWLYKTFLRHQQKYKTCILYHYTIYYIIYFSLKYHNYDKNLNNIVRNLNIFLFKFLQIIENNSTTAR